MQKSSLTPSNLPYQKFPLTSQFHEHASIVEVSSISHKTEEEEMQIEMKGEIKVRNYLSNDLKDIGKILAGLLRPPSPFFQSASQNSSKSPTLLATYCNALSFINLRMHAWRVDVENRYA